MKLGRTIAYLVLLGLALFEAASPFVAKSQLDGNATKAAFEAVLQYERTNDVKSAKERAAKLLADGGCSLIADDPVTPNDESFWVDDEGGVHLVATKTAPSLVLGKWSRTKHLYTVTQEAESKRSRL